MSYNPSIPQATDDPTQSQSQILTNFTQLNNIFGVNHIEFDAASGNGEHTLVTFNDVQAVDPIVVSPKTALYTKTTSGKQELFFDNDTIVSQLTGLVSVLGASGYTTLSNGIIIKWGSSSVTNVANTVTFPVAFPANCWAVVATSNYNFGSPITTISVDTLLPASFKCHGAIPAGQSLYYIAIGN